MYVIIAARRMTPQKVKFAYMVEILTPEMIAMKVNNLLKNIPEENQFAILKNCYIHYGNFLKIANGLFFGY